MNEIDLIELFCLVTLAISLVTLFAFAPDERQ